MPHSREMLLLLTAPMLEKSRRVAFDKEINCMLVFKREQLRDQMTATTFANLRYIYKARGFTYMSYNRNQILPHFPTDFLHKAAQRSSFMKHSFGLAAN